MDLPLPVPITLEDPRRLDSALASFRAGGYIYYLGNPVSVGLQRGEERFVEVRFFVQSAPGERTDASARRLFGQGHTVLQFLRDAWSSLRGELEGRPLSFALFEDYGTGSILLCSESKDAYVWH